MLKLNYNAIFLLMARNNMSITELAKKLGCTSSATTRILRSKKTQSKTAGKLATALGVDVSEIVIL